MDLLNSWDLEVLPHPPYSYSPDLAPPEFHLFPKMKKHLRGQHFYFNKDVKMKLRNGYMPRTHFSSMKDLTN
jgi:hypothetical protein